MDFKDTLNSYLDILNCSAKQLSDKSGLSQTVISRYRNGERTPKVDSPQLKNIITAIYELSIAKGINNTYNDITEHFINCVNNVNSHDNDIFVRKLNYLIKFLDISVSEMCQYIPFSTSYISKVRNKKAIIKDYDYFISCISKYIVQYYSNFNGKKLISDLLELDLEKIQESDKLLNYIKVWLKSDEVRVSDMDNTNKFLHTLDSFNLNDYIKAIKFDELKIPHIPFYNVKCKNYYGIEEMKKGELDFFKAAVLIKQNDDIFMCSNMPMEDMAKDVEFGKKWMFAIAMSIKKGMHINIIHNINRPFNEMMLGLESWIPIYMTGQVSPYYLNYDTDKVYQHLTYVSSTVALTGECAFNEHVEGKYYLTNKKEEVAYYKNKANVLLENAKSLMDIYTKLNINDYKLFLNTLGNVKCDINETNFSLPLFTISDELLIEILKYNELEVEEINKILEYKAKISKYYMDIIKNNKVTIRINHDEKNMEKKRTLDIDPLIFEKEIYYTDKEYKEHLLLTKQFENKYTNFKLELLKDNIFSNIKITSYNNNFVIISKLSNPTIHFVIKHPKLRKAIDGFKVPVIE